MPHINFDSFEDVEQHECSAIRDGDWIIYRCSKCRDYERRYNWRTGQMKTRGQNLYVRHKGVYHMSEYREAFENQN